MVERKEYLQKLWSWKDEQVIKAVSYTHLTLPTIA